ncbi:hypothetical protein FIV00_17170 [Labrenzia sp. THAF82]|uniref:DUF3291 domain-containing protein n=1 Tax=Labrenzia sp. THAF82 TaxID=2587861 RepID=UPI001267C87E|nr:DUF3291 domain-containing protein [Labrenzia sp. THAF82]QFT32225.1 hypothetical protein FIV00_17170 [Labrenzia sp. THAF82]
MPDSDCHLAQLNIARARFDYDAPEMADFLAAVDLVSGAADRFPGFVWRLDDQTGGMNRGAHPRDIVNLSVWQSAEALDGFFRHTVHRHFYARKSDWFLPPEEAHCVFWWQPAGVYPTLEDGLQNLERLRQSGPDAHLFDRLPLATAGT